MSWYSPSLKVFVYFKNERGVCAAITDSLSAKEAESIRKMWDRPDRKVTRVVLQDSVGRVYKEYTY